MTKQTRIVLYVLMALTTVIVVLPFAWMLLMSFKTNGEIMSSPLSLPKGVSWDNYINALKTLNRAEHYLSKLLCACAIFLPAPTVCAPPICVSDCGIGSFALHTAFSCVQDQFNVWFERAMGSCYAVCCIVYFV